MPGPLTKRLQTAPPWAFNLFAILAAFSTYACMYAFRKPFTAATFDEPGPDGVPFQPQLAGVDYKIWLVAAQLVGYMLSKFIGIRVVSEMTAARRAWTIFLLIAVAEAALLGFALIPSPYNIPFMFLNGLPLGMVWGLVFSYLEGRRYTDLLGAGLCTSFIVSSGIVKSVGSLLMQGGVGQFWMPFITGLLFLPLLMLALFLLNQLPPPSPAEVASQSAREPMTRTSRRKLFQKLSIGLVLLVVLYTLLTALRDFRDNFMADILKEMNENAPENFTLIELIVSVGVLAVLGGLVLVRNNFRALMINHLMIGLGVLLTGLSTLLYHWQSIAGTTWLVGIGLGIYMAYVPFNAFLFDRLLATFKYVGTASFLIMVADAFGYLGSTGVMFYKNFAYPDLQWTSFLMNAAYVLTFIGLGFTGGAMVYFWQKRKNRAGPLAPLPEESTGGDAS